MRTILIATAGLAIAAAGAADAQQRVVMRGPGTMGHAGAGYGMPGRAPMMAHPNPPVLSRPAMNTGGHQVVRSGSYSQSRSQVRAGAGQNAGWSHNNGGRPVVVGQNGRWGSKVGGRWWGGANAPGGWNAYRRPTRGWAVPSYWVSPRFYVNDWQTYGLSQPGPGYNWVRYYDDAVLIDGRGSVYDTADGIDWDRYDDGDYYADDAVYADAGDRGGYVDDRGYDDRGYDGRGYDGRAYDGRGYDDRGHDGRGQRRENGVGGAVTGAVVGGVAGNLIGGRGNRLGGTLIGAGVGAAAGYAIDKAEDRGRRAPPPPVARGYDSRGYGAGYAAPGGYAPQPPVAYAPPPPPRGAPGWRSADGTTTVTTTNGGGYAQGGYYYPGASTTTVVVQTAPVVTTTTTEIYEDSVTYSRPKKVWKKRAVARCACK